MRHTRVLVSFALTAVFCSSVGALGQDQGSADSSWSPCFLTDAQGAPDYSCQSCAVPSFCAPEASGWYLPRSGIRIGGWVEGGVSVVGTHPTDGYNGVVTFGDRDGEVLMNQLWFFAEREADTGGYGWAWGGRVDFVYGTDARFTQASDGLEANWGQTERLYQVALPQFYFDVAWNDLTIRTGHFFTILGYEVVPATGNFFYSHSYAMQYCEPFTHTGILATQKLGDQWKLSAGIHRGIDQFDDTDGRDTVNVLGGLTWTSRNERLSLAMGVNASEQCRPIGGILYNAHTTDYSVVGTLKVTDRLTWVVQHDWLQNTAFDTPTGHDTFTGYGVNQYWFYTLTEQWSLGVRAEWLRDCDGELVHGLGLDNVAGPGGFAGDFFEVSAGLNWRPIPRLVVRPELRWDWFEPDPGVTARPFDSGNENNQFLFGCDFILTW